MKLYILHMLGSNWGFVFSTGKFICRLTAVVEKFPKTKICSFESFDCSVPDASQWSAAEERVGAAVVTEMCYFSEIKQLSV